MLADEVFAKMRMANSLKPQSNALRRYPAGNSVLLAKRAPIDRSLRFSLVPEGIWHLSRVCHIESLPHSTVVVAREMSSAFAQMCYANQAFLGQGWRLLCYIILCWRA